MDEALQRLNAAGARYLLIGGQAMRLLGMPRFSMDWDFFIPARDEANLDRINQALDQEIDLPLVPLGPRGENFIQTYQTRWGVLQFHLGVPGLPKFDDAEAKAVTRSTDQGTPVKCVSGRDLLAAKAAAGRPQDLSDIEYLRELEKLGKL